MPGRYRSGGLSKGNLHDTNVKATSIDEDIFSDQESISEAADGDLILVLDVSETPDKVKYITNDSKSVVENLAKNKMTEVGLFKTSSSHVFLSEAITLTGQRIIQESALFTNTHMNKVLRGEIELEL